MNFTEFYRSRGGRIYINWFNQNKSHNKSASLSISRDLDIHLDNVYMLENEDRRWYYFKYLNICYNGTDLLSRYGVNPNDADMFPYVIVSNDGSTWSLTGFDETFSFNSIKFIGRLIGFVNASGTEQSIHNVLDAIAEDFNFDNADDYLESIIRSTFECVFYQLECEKHLVDKSNNLSLYYVGAGQLTEECDILNPSILISTDYDYPDSVFSANYVYIEKFKRYYYITKITSVRTNLWRVDLHVDVLYSYKDDIYEQKGFFERAGTPISSSSYLVDSYIPLINIPLTYTREIDFSYNDEEIRDNRFDIIPQYLYTANNNNIIVNVIEKNQSPTITDFATGTIANGLPSIYRGNFKNKIINSYIIKPTDLQSFMNVLKNDDTLASYVASIIALPFLLPPNESGTTPRTIYLNETSSTIQGYELVSNLSNYLRIAKFDFNDYLPISFDYDFLNYEPYTQVEMYIPYYGWTKINLIDVLGGTISVYYVMDYIAGNSQAVVYNETQERVVFSSSSFTGVKIGISTTNQREIDTQKGTNAISLGASLTASAISTFIGIASENPLAIAGGVIGTVSGIASYVNKDALLFDRANAQFSDGNTGIFAPQKIMLRFTIRTINENDDLDCIDNLHEIQGYVNHTYSQISFFESTGFAIIENIHYVPNTQKWITSTEIDEILNLAKNGIFL